MSEYPLWNWVLIGIGVFSGAFGALFFRWGALQLPDPSTIDIKTFLLCIISNSLIWLGGVLYAIPLAIWVWLLRTMPLSILQPALALTYVVSALLALFILHEAVSLQRWLGIIVIIGGVFIVARS